MLKDLGYVPQVDVLGDVVGEKVGEDVFPILLLLTVVRDHVPDVIVKLFGPFPDASLTQL